MKVLRPAFPRAVGVCMSSLFWTSLLGAMAVGFVKFMTLINRMDDPRHALSPAAERILVFALLAAFAVMAVLLAILALLSPFGTRYVVGATELTIHRGTLWHRTTTLPLIGITRIEAASGPLMRLLGLTDLHVYASVAADAARQGARESAAAVLRGLRDTEEARSFLLDRRESLQEAAIRGDYYVAKTPQELQLQRLAGAIERLERRLPGASSRG